MHTAKLMNRKMKSAFTLFELLVVMGIVAILAGLTIGLAEGLERRSARLKALGELAYLAQALESYKAHYGDFPWIEPGPEPGRGGAGELYAALIGNQGPTGGFGLGVDGTDALAEVKGRHFVDLGLLQTAEVPIPLSGGHGASLDVGYADNFFVDPWGNPYVYQYKKVGGGLSGGGDWKRPGFLLMSFGPDGIEGATLPSDGIPPADYFENENSQDNIISGQ